MQGQLDIDLDETGLAQAAAVGPAARRAPDPTLILSSDQSRAASTAAALGALTEPPVALDQRLRERTTGRGRACSRPRSGTRWPEEYDRWQRRGVGAARHREHRTTCPSGPRPAFADAAEQVGDGTAVAGHPRRRRPGRDGSAAGLARTTSAMPCGAGQLPLHRAAPHPAGRLAALRAQRMADDVSWMRRAGRAG